MLHSRKRFNQWLPALFDGEFDWDFLKPAFKETKIEPMDYDAVVERKGHFLIFATNVPGKEINLGQRITLTNEWRRRSSIIHLEGKTPQTICRYALYAEGTCGPSDEFGGKTLNDCNWTDVLFDVRCWFCWASGIKKPTREEWDRELWVWDNERSPGLPLNSRVGQTTA